MAGNPFTHFGTHALIADFILRQKTGSLHVTPNSRHLYFEDGNLVYAGSDIQGEHFSHILVELGTISPEDLIQAKTELEHGQNIGRFLKEKGLATSQQLSQALKLQITRSLNGILIQESGEVQLEESGLPKQVPRLKIQTVPLFVKSVIQINEDRFCEVFADDREIKQGANWARFAEDLDNPGEHKTIMDVLLSLDQPTIGALKTASTLPTETFDKCIHALSLLNILEVCQPQTNSVDLDQPIQADDYEIDDYEEDPRAFVLGGELDDEDEGDDLLADVLEGEDTDSGEEVLEWDDAPVGHTAFDETVRMRHGERDLEVQGEDGDFSDSDGFSEDDALLVDEEYQGQLEDDALLVDEEYQGQMEDDALLVDEEYQGQMEDDALLDDEEYQGQMEDDALLDDEEYQDDAEIGPEQDDFSVEDLQSALGEGDDSWDGDTLAGDHHPLGSPVASDLNPDDIFDGVAETLPSTSMAQESKSWADAPLETGAKAEKTKPNPLADIILPDAEDEDAWLHKPAKKSNRLRALVALLMIFGLVALGGLWMLNRDVSSPPPSVQTANAGKPKAAQPEVKPKAITSENADLDAAATAGEEPAPEKAVTPPETKAADNTGSNASGQPVQIQAKQQEKDPEAAKPQGPKAEPAVTANKAKTESSQSNPSVSEAASANRARFLQWAQESKTRLVASGARFSIAFIVACEEKTVASVFERFSPTEVFIVERDIEGRRCFILMWGAFTSHAEASQAVSSMPKGLVNASDQPWIVDLKKYIY